MAISSTQPALQDWGEGLRYGILSTADGSQLSPFLGIAPDWKELAPQGSHPFQRAAVGPMPIGTGMQEYKDLALLPQFGTTMRSHPSFQASCGISRDLAVNNITAQLPPLPNPASLIPPQMLTQRALLNKPPACKSLSQSWFPREPDPSGYTQMNSSKSLPRSRNAAGTPTTMFPGQPLW